MLDSNIPSARHGQKRTVGAVARLAVLDLRRQHPEAALLCDAIEALVKALSDIVIDCDDMPVGVAAITACALRRYHCSPSLRGALGEITNVEA